MASVKGYATAQNVRDFLGGQVATYLTDAMIEVFISECEGVIDTYLKVGTNGYSLTYSALKAPHLILRQAATAGAAIKVLACSSLSWQTLEQAVNARDSATYFWETSIKMLLEDNKPVGTGDHILNQ